MGRSPDPLIVRPEQPRDSRQLRTFTSSAAMYKYTARLTVHWAIPGLLRAASDTKRSRDNRARSRRSARMPAYVGSRRRRSRLVDLSATSDSGISMSHRRVFGRRMWVELPALLPWFCGGAGAGWPRLARSSNPPATWHDVPRRVRSTLSGMTSSTARHTVTHASGVMTPVPLPSHGMAPRVRR